MKQFQVHGLPEVTAIPEAQKNLNLNFASTPLATVTSEGVLKNQSDVLSLTLSQDSTAGPFLLTGQCSI